MKNLKSSLFNKFEQNKITNLAKVVGGEAQATSWTNSEGANGLDTIEYGCSNGHVATAGNGEKKDCDFCITTYNYPLL